VATCSVWAISRHCVPITDRTSRRAVKWRKGSARIRGVPLDSYKRGRYSPLDTYRTTPSSWSHHALTSAPRGPPRLARPARAEDALALSHARVGDQPTRPADLGRRVGDESGLALSRSAAPREGGPDQQRLGRDRQQPAGPLLPADRCRTARPRQRGGELEALRRGARHRFA